MPLSIVSRAEQNFAVLELSGALTLGPSLHGLRQTAQKAIDSAKSAGLLLDVSRITMTDSSGLGELTVIYSLANRKNCSLMLVGVPPQLQQILEITRLDALLPSAPDIEAAKKKIKKN